MAMFPLKLMGRILPWFFLASGDFPASLGIPWLIAVLLQHLPLLAVITRHSHCVSLCLFL